MKTNPRWSGLLLVRGSDGVNSDLIIHMEALAMRNFFGALASTALILCMISGTLQAGEFMHPKKYGFELTLGGGYYLMSDVNDFIPDAAFIDGTLNDDDKINIGNQLGIGFIYRNMENFGWVFGYNRLNAGIPVAITGTYRISTNFFDANAQRYVAEESWVEQTLTGSELYVMPTWYGVWKDFDVSLSMGPAVYRAMMDRSVSITRSIGGNGPNSTGSFSDGDGTALGFLISFGLEIPIFDTYFVNIQAGGRLANIGELSYEDNQNIDRTVINAANAPMEVDFTGGYLKASIRTYFKPTSNWRSPRR